MTHTPHPSRAAPKCLDCRHMTTQPRTGRHYCNHPTMPVDLTTGEARVSTDGARADAQEIASRFGIQLCTAAAVLFEPWPASGGAS